MNVDIFILNYNGKQLLETYLPSVIAVAHGSSHNCRVIVVDNLSTDGSVEFITSRFPSVYTFVAKKNEVLCSYNDAVKSYESDIVVFLNNDIKVKDDFLDYLLGHFKEDDVFFVGPRILNLDGSFNGGRSFLKFELGIIKCIVDKDNALHPGLTISAGAGAFKRDIFLKLGGYGRLYLPGIWDEVDLCYRSYLIGKKGYYEPRSIIWHQGSASFNKEYGTRYKLILAHRNMFLFFWKNINNRRLIAEHIFFVPLRIIYSILSGKIEFAQGFMRALPKLPFLLTKRFSRKRQLALGNVQDTDLIIRRNINAKAL